MKAAITLNTPTRSTSAEEDLPEGLWVSSFCKDRFCESDNNSEVRVPSVPDGAECQPYTWYTYFLLTVVLLPWKHSQHPCFEGWKIKGNGNSKIFYRRTKLFCETVLLWTVNSLCENMAVFTVSDQSKQNSEMG